MDRYRTRIVTGHSDYTAVAALIFAVADLIASLLLKVVQAVVSFARRVAVR